MTSLIAGTGTLGKRFYQLLQQTETSIYTLSRSDKNWSAQHLIRDLHKPLQELPFVDNLYIILSPDNRDPINYRATYLEASCRLVSALQKINPQLHSTFISSTSVYDAKQLGIINEESPTLASTFSGKILLETEQRLTEACYSLSIVRAAGLYSNQRPKLLAHLRNPELLNKSPRKFYNLIHEQDLVNIILQSAMTKRPISIAADGCPFTLADFQNPTLKAIDHQADQKADNYRCLQSLYFVNNALTYPSIFHWREQQL